MKLSTPRSFIYASILLLLIHPHISLCSFLSQIFIHNNIDLQQQVSDASDTQGAGDFNNQNYYELVAFINFLTTYNFTNGWTGMDASDSDQEASGSGLTVHTCYPNPAALNQAMGIICILQTTNINQQASVLQYLTFDFKDAEQYTLYDENSQLVFTGVPTNISSQTNSRNPSNQTCLGNLTYSFINADLQEPFDYTTDQLGDLSIQITFQGQNCSEQVSTSLLMTDQYDVMSGRISPYLFMMVGIALVQLFTCSKIMKDLDRSDLLARKISVGMVSFFIAFGFYIFLKHFEYWMTMPGLMLGVVLLYFMISLFFEPTMLYFVFRSIKRTHDLTLIMSIFYKLCFWLLFTSTSVILSFTYLPDCMLYAYSFFLLPQIVDNVLCGRKFKWNLWILLGVGCPNYIYIIYIAFDPLKLFSNVINTKLMIFCSVVFFVQMIVLQIQTRKPSFGFKIGGRYDYSDLGTSEEKEAAFTDACSICMEKLNQQPLIGPSEPLLQHTHKGSSVLRTPCKHYYHDSCLQEWVKKKLECPNCRQAIPMLADEDD